MAIYWQTLSAGCMIDSYSTTETLFKKWYKSMNFIRRLKTMRVDSLRSLFDPLALSGYMAVNWGKFGTFSDLLTHAKNRRLARSKNGYLCLVPDTARIGDSISLCKGGTVPLILRRDSESWNLIGEAYVHGIMKGEKWNDEACREMILQ
jgi:hypothetical protein